MSQRKEAIELVGTIFAIADTGHEPDETHGLARIEVLANQVLALLKVEQLPTKWTVFIEHLELNQKLYCLEYDDRRIANITKDQYESFEALLGKEQPPAGDFTQDFRKLLRTISDDQMPSPQGDYKRMGHRACAIIDRSEASRKELLTASKNLSVVCQKIGLTDDQNMRDKLAQAVVRVEAAIKAQGD